MEVEMFNALDVLGQSGSGGKGRRQSADKGVLHQELQQKLTFGSTLFSFYSIPAVSFLMHTLAHIFNLCICAMQIQFAVRVSVLDELENEPEPRLPNLSVLECIQFGVQIAFQLDSQLQLLERDELHSIQDSRSILYRSLLKVDWLFFASCILRISASLVPSFDSARTCYSSYIAILSLHGILVVLDVLPFLGRLSRPFGILLLALEQMMQQVKMFIILSLVLMCAMAFGLMGLAQSGSFDEASSPGTVDRHVWYLLPAFAYVAPPFADIDQFDGFAAIVMMVYLFFTTKVMQSLINAIFGRAINGIFEHAEIEYNWNTQRTTYDHRHVLLTMPPPLNLPVVLIRLGKIAHRHFAEKSAKGQMLRQTKAEQQRSIRLAAGASIGKNADQDSQAKIAILPYVEKFRKDEAKAQARSLSQMMGAVQERQSSLFPMVYALRADMEKQSSAMDRQHTAMMAVVQAQQKQLDKIVEQIKSKGEGRSREVSESGDETLAGATSSEPVLLRISPPRPRPPSPSRPYFLSKLPPHIPPPSPQPSPPWILSSVSCANLYTGRPSSIPPRPHKLPPPRHLSLRLRTLRDRTQ
jgi:hypothetical protein